jgi:hypothetical protein
LAAAEGSGDRRAVKIDHPLLGAEGLPHAVRLFVHASNSGSRE